MATEPQPTNTTPPPAPSPTSTYTSLQAYPFTSDAGFLSGLSQIFGHPGTPVTESELSQKPDLVLSAKCFYFSRKFQTPTPIDPAAYRQWLSSQTTSQPTAPSIPETNTSTQPQDATAQVSQAPPPAAPSTTQPNSSSTTTSPDQQPPYPISFAAIVDLITNNKPVPGIEEIPTTVLEPGSSKQDRATRRRKPWEKDVAEPDPVVVDGTVDEVQAQAGTLQGNGDTQAPTSCDEGLLRLLRPDAVPDSGLVARD